MPPYLHVPSSSASYADERRAGVVYLSPPKLMAGTRLARHILGWLKLSEFRDALHLFFTNVTD